MTWLKKLSCFLIVLSALSFSGGDAYAQNVFKLDFFKTPGKFGTWVQKQAENFENAMKEIGESQFATFIGKGIEAAKKGIKFAKEKMDEIKNVYQRVKGKIDEAKQSTTYKVAMLSKQVASETTVLNGIKKQRDTEKATIKAETEMKKTALAEKIKVARENFNIGVQVLEGEIVELKSVEEKDLKRQEIDEFKRVNSDSIASMEREISELEENSREEIKNIDLNFAASIVAQTAIITNLGVEIAELIAQSRREKGEMNSDVGAVIENAINDFSYREGELITLEIRDKKEKTRHRKRETISTAASGYSAGIISKTRNKKEDESQNSATSETVSGKSEALQTAISQTVVQLDSLYEYLLLELKAIELETANIMSENKEYQAGKAETSINICNYEVDKKSFLQSLKDAKNKAQGVVDGVKSGVDKAKDVVGTVTDTVENVKSNPADAITGLTGM